MSQDTLIVIAVVLGVFLGLATIGMGGGWLALQDRAGAAGWWTVYWANRAKLFTGPRFDAAAARFAEAVMEECKVPEEERRWKRITVECEFRAAVKDFFDAKVREAV